MTLAERTARARWPGCGWEVGELTLGDGLPRTWWPEHNESQAAELIEEAKIDVSWMRHSNEWHAAADDGSMAAICVNRRTAICMAYLAWAEQRSRT